MHPFFIAFHTPNTLHFVAQNFLSHQNQILTVKITVDIYRATMDVQRQPAHDSHSKHSAVLKQLARYVF